MVLIAIRIVMLLLLPASLFMAKSASAQISEVQRVCAFLSCPPSQTAKLLERLDEQSIELSSLADQNRISLSTLRAIAIELDLRNPNLGRMSYIRIIRARATEASELRTQIANLRSLIDVLESDAPVAQIEAGIERAQAAFDGGDLRKAESELSAIRSLAVDGWEQSNSAWLKVVEAEARLAHIRGDTVKRRQVLRDARRLTAELANSTQWRLAIQEARYEASDGRRFGNNESLERALEIIQDDAAPFVSKETTPSEWVETQILVGDVLRVLGERQPGIQRLEDAISVYESALSIATEEGDPLRWARIKSNLGTALHRVGDRSGHEDRIAEAITVYRQALAHFPPHDKLTERTSLLNNFGPALVRWGTLNAQSESIREGIALLEEARTGRDRQSNRFAWALTNQNLAGAFYSLGILENDHEVLDRSARAYRASLEVRTRNRVPVEWVRSQLGLARTMIAIADFTSDETAFREAINILREVAPVLSVLEHVQLRTFRRSIYQAARDLDTAKGWETMK